MENYDSIRFSPPAPLAHVTVRNPENGMEEREVPMLLDTGSDVTLVPQKHVAKLKLDLSAGRQYELAGFDDHKSYSQAVKLHLIFEEKTFRGEFLLIDQDYGVIGRNVLNLLNLQFIGQKLTWNII